MIGADALGGEGDGVTHIRGAGCGAGLDLGLADPDGVFVEVGPVETPGVVQKGREALRPHALDDFRRSGVHLGRLAAALVEEGVEGGLEAGVLCVEAAHGA